jgi:hypothetical protein
MRRLLTACIASLTKPPAPATQLVEDVKGRRTPVSDLEFRRSHRPRA